MTMLKFLKAVSLLGLGISQIAAQSLVTGPPETKWVEQIFGPSGNAPFRRGNGVFLTPDGSKVIALSNDATVVAYDAKEGGVTWEDKPAPGSNLVSESGISFNDQVLVHFMVYAVNDEATGKTSVIARDMEGNKLWESEPLTGEHAGTPVISANGKYVYLTHNAADKTTGYFTILSTDVVDGIVSAVVESSHVGDPFAPVGIYHEPDTGYYDPIDGTPYDGFLNNNDIVLWGVDIVALNTVIGDGFTFGFQFPSSFDDQDFSGLGHFQLSDNSRPFRTRLPPLITNEGRTAYYSTSRSQFFAWTGAFAKFKFRFSRGATIKEEFSRDLLWTGQPCWSMPVESEMPDGSSAIFGGGAWHEIFRIDHRHNADFSDITFEKYIMETSDVVYASIKVDPMKRVIYYVQKDGVLNQVPHDFTDNSTALWTMEFDDGVESEMALNDDGTLLYIVTTKGELRALQLAISDDTDAPTNSPTVQPTKGPSTAAPTNPPVVGGTPSPTDPESTDDEGDVGSGDGDDNESGAAAQHMLFVTVAIVYSLFM